MTGHACASALDTVAQVAGAAAKRTALVASDDVVIAPRAVHLLSETGFDVCVAPDAGAAWREAAQAKPTLAIVDILIPGSDVRDSVALTLDLVRQQVPVLLLCSITSLPLDPALKLLPRNFDDDELLAVVDRLLTHSS